MNTKIDSLDDKETIEIHRKIIQQNKLLNSVYREFYKIFKKNHSKKPVVEIGSGPGFIKNIIPGTITTDVVAGAGIDRIEFAEKLSFKNSSVGTFIMMNVLHHIKNPAVALSEFLRCLKRGGRVVMIEPAITFWGKIIYKYLHHEICDPLAGWKIPGKGRLSDANIALPYIIFVKDAKKFELEFPGFTIKKIEYHSPLSYLLSGGLSKPQIFSKIKYKYIKRLEDILIRLSSEMSMFMTVVIEKI